MRARSLLLALAGALLAAACSILEPAGAGTTSATLSRSDRAILDQAAQANIAEIRSGRLAEQKSASDEVKRYGERMVLDHTRANEELQQLAAANGIQLPRDADLAHKAGVTELSARSGAAFDRDYMTRMVKDHEATLAKLEKAARQAQNPELRAWAAKAAPEVRAQLQQGQQLASELGTGAASRGSSHPDVRGVK